MFQLSSNCRFVNSANRSNDEFFQLHLHRQRHPAPREDVRHPRSVEREAGQSNLDAAEGDDECAGQLPRDHEPRAPLGLPPRGRRGRTRRRRARRRRRRSHVGNAFGRRLPKNSFFPSPSQLLWRAFPDEGRRKEKGRGGCLTCRAARSPPSRPSCLETGERRPRGRLCRKHPDIFLCSNFWVGLSLLHFFRSVYGLGFFFSIFFSQCHKCCLGRKLAAKLHRTVHTGIFIS